MQNKLSEEQKEKIINKLPTIDDRYSLATHFGMGVVNHDLDNESELHISLVCLNDACRRLNQVRVALSRSYKWFWGFNDEEHTSKKQQEFRNVWESKLYADYVMLLLYAVVEDFAAFILHFLEVEAKFKKWLKEDSTIKKLEDKRISSLHAQVGVFMAEKYRNHKITKSILVLRDNPNWNQAMKYRNTWVHDKPPIINGLGYEYDRESRVKIGEGYKSFPIGFGSPANFDIEELMEIASQASKACGELATKLIDDLIDKRTNELGEKIDFEKNEISSEIF